MARSTFSFRRPWPANTSRARRSRAACSSPIVRCTCASCIRAPVVASPSCRRRDDGLWKLPEPWTHRTRPPLLGKRTRRVSHSYHRHPKCVTYVPASESVTHVVAPRTEGRPLHGLDDCVRDGLKAVPYMGVPQGTAFNPSRLREYGRGRPSGRPV